MAACKKSGDGVEQKWHLTKYINS